MKLNVFIASRYENTGKTHRFPVIETFESWLTVEEVLSNTLEKYQGDPRARRLFIKQEDGTRRTFQMTTKADDRGFSSGEWYWKEFTIKWDDIRLNLKPNPCARCGGLGTVGYGMAMTIFLGRKLRLCFDCHGRGFVA